MKSKIEAANALIRESRNVPLSIYEDQINYLTQPDQIMLQSKMDKFEEIVKLLIDLGREMESFCAECAKFAVTSHKMSYACSTGARDKNRLQHGRGDGIDNNKKNFDVDTAGFLSDKDKKLDMLVDTIFEKACAKGMIPRFYKNIGGLKKLELVRDGFEHKYLNMVAPYKDPKIT